MEDFLLDVDLDLTQDDLLLSSVDLSTGDSRIGSPTGTSTEVFSQSASSISTPASASRPARGVTLIDLWQEARDPRVSEPVRNKHNQKIFYCRHCSWSAAASNRIRTHLRDAHRINIAKAGPTARQAAVSKSIGALFGEQRALQEGRNVSQEKELVNAIDQPAFYQALCLLVTRRNIPYNCVEWPEFWTLIHSVNYMANGIVNAGRNKLPELIQDSFFVHQTTLKEKLATSLSKISFSIDAWSSSSHTDFLGVVAHFVEKGQAKPHKALLAFREINGPHSGALMAEMVLQVIEEYEISQQVGFFTLDNASNNKTMLKAIGKTLGFDPDLRYCHCNGHTLNLAMHAFLFGKTKHAAEEASQQIAVLSQTE